MNAYSLLQAVAQHKKPYCGVFKMGFFISSFGEDIIIIVVVIIIIIIIIIKILSFILSFSFSFFLSNFVM